MAKVRLEKINKSYGKSEILHDINLDIADHEFLVLVGPSGCGKSTLLRMIAGLEDVSSGDISIGERVVNNIEPKNRNIAMVFQNYALYPHMTVFKNMSFGLRAAKLKEQDINDKVMAAAKILKLTELLDRKPAQLSGGERQRVSMGRAIVRNPDVFLFDEPLSNLDATLRTSMRAEIKKLHHKLKATMIYVTHDQVEAMTLADRIVILRSGKIQQIGTPMDLYKKPANLFVAGFIGSPAMNFLDDFEFITGIRPEDIYINGDTPKSKIPKMKNSTTISAKVALVEHLGAESFIIFDHRGDSITVKSNGTITPMVGEKMDLILNLDKSHLFDKKSEERV
jgi:multiple sugar transport system ATP-binding protein